MEVLDSIRRIVAEDAAHGSIQHELYLTRETLAQIEADAEKRGLVRDRSRSRPPPTILGITYCVQNVGRDCIATLRDGKIISVTNL